MQGRDLYQHLLGLREPWRVEEIELSISEESIYVRVSHPRGTKFCCPECHKELACYDHGEERQWRHLDSCQFKTILVASPPRVDCPEHGVRTVPLPWAEPNSRFTMLFERFAIDVLQATHTVKGARQILRTNWDQTWHILERAVARGKLRKADLPVPRIGVDEKAFRKGQDYITLLYDLDRSTVEAIADGNGTRSANDCFYQLSSGQIQSIQAIAMDMSAAYIKSAKDSIPLAEEKIVHDRFHIMKLATEAVDQVRRAEQKRLLENGDDRVKGTRFLRLTSQENLSPSQSNRFDQIYQVSLQTGRAWGYKEMLRDLWNHEDTKTATSYFQDWYNRVIHTNLGPLKKLARTLKGRLQNIVNFCRHEITNAVAEGINSKIMAIKRRAGGFRNPHHYKTIIFFYCEGLDLYTR